MDLNQLRTFIAVCEAQNVTKAAQRLYMTPPSVSAHIKALEEALNVRLFERTSKGMELTPKGAILREKAEQTLQAAQALVNYATELQAYLMGKLTIGLNALPRVLQVGPLTHTLREAAPGIELHFTQSVTGRIIADLQHGRLDIGYLFGPVVEPSLRVQPVSTVRLVVAMPSAWAAAVQAADWSGLADLPWIYADLDCPFQTMTDQLFAQRGLVYQQAVVSADDATKCELVQAGVGITLLEETEAKEAAQAGRLAIWAGEPIGCELSFACLTSRAEEPLIKAGLAALAAVWRVDSQVDGRSLPT
jgi:DNA-binding transcriptional LysR family regulator